MLHEGAHKEMKNMLKYQPAVNKSSHSGGGTSL